MKVYIPLLVITWDSLTFVEEPCLRVGTPPGRPYGSRRGSRRRSIRFHSVLSGTSTAIASFSAISMLTRVVGASCVGRDAAREVSSCVSA